MPRRFLRRTAEGGNQAVFNNLLSLSWEVLFDSRQITPIASGSPIPLWPDISGNGRDANPVPGFNPLYRTNSSPTGVALADFGAVANSQMTFTLSVGGVGNTAGFSFYAWYILDSVPSAGGGDGQLVLADANANGFRLFASEFVGAGDVRPQFHMSSNVTPAAGNPATGVHTLAVTCAPPSGTGQTILYHDGVQVATGTWTGNPGTGGLLSGNAVQNVWVRGRVGMAGFGKRVDSPSTVANVLSLLRRVWG